MKRRKETEEETEMVRVFLVPPNGRGMGWSGQLPRWQIETLIETFRRAAVELEMLRADLAEAEVMFAQAKLDMEAVLEMSRRLHDWFLRILERSEGERRQRMLVQLEKWQQLREVKIAKARMVLERAAKPLAVANAGGMET
jgi:hypothetical protein